MRSPGAVTFAGPFPSPRGARSEPIDGVRRTPYTMLALVILSCIFRVGDSMSVLVANLRVGSEATSTSRRPPCTMRPAPSQRTDSCGVLVLRELMWMMLWTRWCACFPGDSFVTSGRPEDLWVEKKAWFDREHCSPRMGVQAWLL
ncbi:hypothetical protein BV20DRAFT_265414 [Pilatotrama ljubarskyi]|nr:hypothetical protein BV20DRAFT_265414 [Pilatotrama ljubarskyi]